MKECRCIEADGTVRWYQKGRLHRDNGPAIVEADGSRHWFINGKRHREDGPAIEWADGSKAWFLNGVEYTEELFDKYLLNKKLHQTLEEKPLIKIVKI